MSQKSGIMPQTTDRSSVIKELAEIIEQRSIFKQFREDVDSPDEDEDDIDDMYQYQLEFGKYIIFSSEACVVGCSIFSHPIQQ
jgi:hypothetical protein